MIQNISNTLDTSANANTLGQLQGDERLVAILKERVGDIGVNRMAIFWLVMLIASLSGLIYWIGDSLSVQDFIDKIATDAKVIFISLMHFELPTAPIMLKIMPKIIGQLPAILGGLVLLSLLGLFWSLIARSNQYKSRCRRIVVLRGVIIDLSDQLSELGATIQSAIVEVQRITEDKKRLVTELTGLLESHDKSVPTATQQMPYSEGNRNRISELVDTIRDVIAQISVAALNVSIRAAVAEDGRGTTVFAEQIQRLAELSNGVANDINDLIKNKQPDEYDTGGRLTLADQIDQEVSKTTKQSIVDSKTEQLKPQWELKLSQITLAFEQIESIMQALKQSITTFKLQV